MFDPIRVLSTLNRHGVRYLVIGGYAAGILGAPVMTNDLDVCHDRTPDNLARLAAALLHVLTVLREAIAEAEGRPTE